MNTHTHTENMKALTFPQFQDDFALRWTRLGYEFDQHDIEATATTQLWHTQNLLPFVESGRELPRAVCKSIVKHGWHSLDWFAKNYPSCLGKYTYVRTGYAINKNDLTK
jgi:hypothetical protein